MLNISAARTQLDHIERILRTRYPYAHPIFEHIASARAHLEPEPTPESEPTVPATATHEDAPPSAPPGEGVAPPSKPAPKVRRARKADR